MKTRSLLWLWGLTAGIRTKLFVNCFLGIIRISASLAFIYTSKLLIDAATSSDIRQDHNITSLSVFLIALFIIQICSGLATSWYSNQNEVKTKNMIRQKLFEHLLKASSSIDCILLSIATESNVLQFENILSLMYFVLPEMRAHLMFESENLRLVSLPMYRVSIVFIVPDISSSVELS